MVVPEQTVSRRAAEFYVVGGPVAPDRPCYCERAADRELYWSLNDGDFCHVLSAPHSGKTSLMARAARRLRDERVAVAVVDLSQIGTRERGADAARWFYSVAHRIARELRLKIDLHVWWQSRANLTIAQRFAEFFWSIVLARTTTRVVVFFDDIEAVLELPHAHEFLSGLRACHDSRATEEEFRRLSIVLLGVATPSSIDALSVQSPLSVSRPVRLADFDFEEVQPLAAGLPPGEAEREQALRRVLYWSGGQPHLTQKLCRALARRRDAWDQAVDALVAEQFFSPGAIRSEPHLAAVRSQLMERSAAPKAALTLYGRIAKGERVGAEPGAALQEALLVCGLVQVRGSHLAIRNRIYRRVFTPRWVNQSLPFDLRSIAVALGVGALVVMVPIWYTQILPGPYVAALQRAADAELAQLVDAYEDLRSIPGHGGTANGLFADLLMRRSARAGGYAEVMQIDALLRELPDGSIEADRLLGSYWSRRAGAEARRELRDEALLAQLQSLVDDRPERRRAAANLIGEDFAQLATVIRPAAPIAGFAASGDGERFALVGRDGQIQRHAAGSGAALGRAFAPTAQEYVAVTRRLQVDADGRAGDFALRLAIDHPRPDDLVLTLSAPSGRSVEHALQPQQGAAPGHFLLNSSTTPALGALRSEHTHGEWHLTLEDRRAGDSGALLSWTLHVGGADYADRPAPAVALPDPRVTTQTAVALSADANRAAVWSAGEAPRGDLTVWDLAERRPLLQIVRDAPIAAVEFAADDSLLVGWMSPPRSELRVWRIADGSETVRLEVGAPAAELILDPSRRLVAFKSVSRDGSGLLRIWDLVNAAWRNRLSYRSPLQTVVLGAGGGRIVSADTSGQLELRDGLSGRVLGRAVPPARIARAAFDRTAERFVTLREDGMLTLWEQQGTALAARWQVRALPDARFAFAAQGDSLVVETGAGVLMRLSASDGSIVGGPLRPGRPGRVAAALAPVAGAERLAVVSGDGAALYIFAAGSAAPGGAAALVTAADVTGQRIGAVSADRRLRVWPAAGEAVREIAVPEQFASITALAFGPEGRIAAGTALGQLALWASLEAVPVLVQHDQGRVAALAFDPVASRLVVAGSFGMTLIDADSGALLSRPGSGDPIHAVAVAVDGTIAAGGEMAGLRLYTRSSEIPLPTSGRISALAFSGHGRLIAAGGEAGELIVWSRDRLDRAVGAGAVGGPIRMLRFDPDEARLAVLSDAWWHQFALAADAIEHRGSRLQPPGLLLESLRNDGNRGLRGVRQVGIEQIRPVEMAWSSPAESPLQGGAEGLIREWGERLDLTVDARGGIVARRRPPPAQ